MICKFFFVTGFGLERSRSRSHFLILHHFFPRENDEDENGD